MKVAITSGRVRCWCDVFVQPGQEHLDPNDKNYGADEKADNTYRQKATDRSQEDNDDGNGDAPPEQQRLQNVVYKGDDNTPNEKGHSRGSASGRKNVDNSGY